MLRVILIAVLVVYGAPKKKKVSPRAGRRPIESAETSKLAVPEPSSTPVPVVEEIIAPELAETHRYQAEITALLASIDTVLDKCDQVRCQVPSLKEEFVVFQNKFKELEPVFIEIRKRLQTPLSAASLDMSYLRIELTRRSVLEHLRWYQRQSGSIDKAYLKSVLEEFLVDAEFCGGIRQCGKVAKGAPPLRPNLDYLFQTVDAQQLKSASLEHEVK